MSSSTPAALTTYQTRRPDTTGNGIQGTIQKKNPQTEKHTVQWVVYMPRLRVHHTTEESHIQACHKVLIYSGSTWKHLFVDKIRWTEVITITDQLVNPTDGNNDKCLFKLSNMTFYCPEIFYTCLALQ